MRVRSSRTGTIPRKSRRRKGRGPDAGKRDWVRTVTSTSTMPPPGLQGCADHRQDARLQAGESKRHHIRPQDAPLLHQPGGARARRQAPGRPAPGQAGHAGHGGQEATMRSDVGARDRARRRARLADRGRPGPTHARGVPPVLGSREEPVGDGAPRALRGESRMRCRAGAGTGTAGPGGGGAAVTGGGTGATRPATAGGRAASGGVTAAGGAPGPGGVPGAGASSWMRASAVPVGTVVPGSTRNRHPALLCWTGRDYFRTQNPCAATPSGTLNLLRFCCYEN
jgi:hypothetical protein